jgi:hypothetical protein
MKKLNHFIRKLIIILFICIPFLLSAESGSKGITPSNTNLGPNNTSTSNESIVLESTDNYITLTAMSDCSTPPATPNTPTVSNRCGQSVISFNGSPPANTLWYWQTIPDGRDRANSNSTITVTSTGIVYLRAFNTITPCWSDACASVTPMPMIVPVIPNTPTVSNQCGQSVITFNGNPPLHSTWYWQTSSSGTDQSIAAVQELLLQLVIII